VDNEPVIADVSNVPTRSGSFHDWEKLFPLLVHSFRTVLVEEDTVYVPPKFLALSRTATFSLNLRNLTTIGLGLSLTLVVSFPVL
jgi:hypothetical protein